MVFVRAPVPGQVKTRLAAEVGAVEAARIYRELAEGTVRRLAVSEAAPEHEHDAGPDAGPEAGPGARADPDPPAASGPPWDVEVHYTPDDPASAMGIRAWLGGIPGLRFVPQSAGDLGMRMESALRRTLARGAPFACVVGSDVPALGPRQVEAGFRALSEGVDLVFGPSPDGGYYLVGARRGTPLQASPLFRGMPWSTEQVLPRSLQRAERLGLRVALLEPLADVDRPEDLPASGIRPRGQERPGRPRGMR